jgi:hypothetical protein
MKIIKINKSFQAILTSDGEITLIPPVTFRYKNRGALTLSKNGTCPNDSHIMDEIGTRDRKVKMKC